MKSTIGLCFNLGSGTFSWCSKKQELVAQSIVKAKYVAATTDVNQALYFRKVLAYLHMEQKESTQVFVDNQTVISISNNPVFLGWTKRFKIKFYFFEGCAERRSTIASLQDKRSSF